MLKDITSSEYFIRTVSSRLIITLIVILTTSSSSNAEETNSLPSTELSSSSAKKNQEAPAPMGIHGANMPAKGQLTVTIMPVFGNRSGWLIGTKGVSPPYIASTTPTFIPSTTNPTPFMRVVPRNVTESTQNALVSYGITENLSTLVTASIVQKQLYAQTFFGVLGGLPMGGNYIGTKGFSDLTTSGIYKLYEDNNERIQLSSGFAYPLSSDTSTMSLFLPNATYDIERAHYAFQPGPRTLDLLTGLLYAGSIDLWSWGMSFHGRFPLAANPQGWRFGDLKEFSGWIGYTIIPTITSTVRLTAFTQGAIRGHDPQIKGYAVPTNPNYYGGQWVQIFGGSTIDGDLIGLKAYSLEFEAGIPIYQNLNGPQIRNNWEAGAAIKLKL